MSYEKQTWVNGEVITADKLNHMENGIGEGGSDTFVVRIMNENGTYSCDHTAQEIISALEAGKNIVGICVQKNNGVITFEKVCKDITIRRLAPDAPINSFIFLYDYFTYVAPSTGYYSQTKIELTDEDNVSATASTVSFTVSEVS